MLLVVSIDNYLLFMRMRLVAPEVLLVFFFFYLLVGGNQLSVVLITIFSPRQASRVLVVRFHRQFNLFFLLLYSFGNIDDGLLLVSGGGTLCEGEEVALTVTS